MALIAPTPHHHHTTNEQTRRRSYEEHNDWLRSLRSTYQERLSSSSLLDDLHQHTEKPHTTHVDANALPPSENRPSAAYSLDRTLALDDSADDDDAPVYRSAGHFAPRVEMAYGEDEGEEHVYRSITMTNKRRSCGFDDAHAKWLRENPPLVCRQNAFFDGKRRWSAEW